MPAATELGSKMVAPSRIVHLLGIVLHADVVAIDALQGVLGAVVWLRTRQLRALAHRIKCSS
jgi:lipopolysaccharide biosynthesis protein